MKRSLSVVRFKFRCNILIIGKIIKEMSGSVASGTPVSRVLSRDISNNNVITGCKQWIVYTEDYWLLKYEAVCSCSYTHKNLRSHNIYYCL